MLRDPAFVARGLSLGAVVLACAAGQVAVQVSNGRSKAVEKLQGVTLLPVGCCRCDNSHSPPTAPFLLRRSWPSQRHQGSPILWLSSWP